MEWEELFKYDEESPSCLTRCTDWLSGMNYQIKKASKGDPVGTVDTSKKGYSKWSLKVNNKTYTISRIVWEIFNGPIPKGMQIDHINGNSLDNKISNLRLVSNRQNSHNQKMKSTNTSGVNGVDLLTNTNKAGKKNLYWKAQWNDENGKRCAKTFSVNVYGYEEAFKLACEYRKMVVEEINNSFGNYTERHGK